MTHSMNKLEETKIYGDDFVELMNEHLDIYTGCSLIMLLVIALFIGAVVVISLFMGPN